MKVMEMCSKDPVDLVHIKWDPHSDRHHCGTRICSRMKFAVIFLAVVILTAVLAEDSGTSDGSNPLHRRIKRGASCVPGSTTDTGWVYPDCLLCLSHRTSCTCNGNGNLDCKKTNGSLGGFFQHIVH